MENSHESIGIPVYPEGQKQEFKNFQNLLQHDLTKFVRFLYSNLYPKSFNTAGNDSKVYKNLNKFTNGPKIGCLSIRHIPVCPEFENSDNIWLGSCSDSRPKFENDTNKTNIENSVRRTD